MNTLQTWGQYLDGKLSDLFGEGRFLQEILGSQWLRRAGAFSISDQWMAGGQLVFAVLLALGVWAEFFFVSFILSWKLLFLYSVATASVVGAFYLLFVKQWGRFGNQQLMKLTNVPKKRAMVLRWKFGNQRTRHLEEFNPDLERELYDAYYSGYVVWSPVLYEMVTNNFINMEPEIYPQDGIEVNAQDGAVIKADFRVTAQVVDPVSHALNTDNTPEDTKKIIQEYLHVDAEEATSVVPKVPRVDESGKNVVDENGMVVMDDNYVELLEEDQGYSQQELQEYYATRDEGEDKAFHKLQANWLKRTHVQGWDSTTEGITQMTQSDMERMARFLSDRMNHWLGGQDRPAGVRGRGSEEIDFGFRTSVKLTVFKPAASIARAQQNLAAAGIEAEAVKKQAEGHADAAANIVQKVQEKQLGTTATTILAGIAMLAPQVRDFLESRQGGGRGKSEKDSAAPAEPKEGKDKK